MLVLTCGEVTTPTYERLPSRLVLPATVSTTQFSRGSQASGDAAFWLLLR